MPESQPRNLRSVREINRRDILLSIDRLPNSTRLFVGGSEGKVFELDGSQASPEFRQLADHGRYVTAVRVVGQQVVSGSYDGRLLWWDLQQGRVVRTIEGHARQVRQIAVAPDGSKIASVGDDMICRVWNATTGERLHELRGHAERTPTHFTSMLYCATFARDGRHLATGDRVGQIKVWEVTSGRQVAAMEAPILYTWDGTQRIRSIGGVRALAFSPDGTQLAVGGVGQIGNVDSLAGPSRVEVFNWARQERSHFFTGAQGIVNKLYWDPQNRWLCALGGGGNGLIMFHDPARRNMIHQGNVAMHVHDAACNEDGTTLYAAGHNKIMVLELRG